MKNILILLSFFLFLSCCADSGTSSSILLSSSSITHSSYSSSRVNLSSSSIAYSSLSAIISSSSENTSFQDLCVQLVNEYRATEDLSPLSRASLTQESCTQDQASQDLKSGVAHGHFGSCEEWAQNTAPSVNVAFYKSEEEMLKKYLKMMWVDEKQLVLEGVTEYKSSAWINMNFY